MNLKCKKVDGLGERIRNSREMLKLSRSQLANKLNVAMSTLQAWENAEREPPASDIVALAKLLGVTTAYLLHSEEEKEQSIGQSFENKRLCEELEDDDFEEIDDFRDVIVTAGFGGENDDYIEPTTTKVERAWLQIRRLKAKDCAMFCVSGDSMEPTLKEGEQIIVDRSRTRLRDGNIFVLNNNGLMLVKRIQATFNGITLLSDNKDYDPIELDADDADRLQVIGQVVRGYRDF